MARTRYVPEREALEPRYGKGDPDFKAKSEDPRHTTNPDKPVEWEFQSVTNFVEFVMDEDRDTFTTAELVALATATGTYNTTLRIVLEGYGLRLVGMKVERNVATFGTNQHDRWTNSGTHGGGGGDQILGFAGRCG